MWKMQASFENNAPDMSNAFGPDNQAQSLRSSAWPLKSLTRYMCILLIIIVMLLLLLTTNLLLRLIRQKEMGLVEPK